MASFTRMRAAAVIITAAAIALAGCAAEEAKKPDAKTGTSLEEIAALAKKEGHVHLIAYPEDWADYGTSFKAFTKKYGVDVEVSSPNASSAEELTAVSNLKGQPTQPDVLDISYSFTKPAVEQGLVSPYVPTLADEIPADLKDPKGNWAAAYYGVLTIYVNPDKVDVPKTWKDLLDPQYKGKISIADPRKSGLAVATVMSAALANGGSVSDIGPGIEFFGKLAKDGYLVSSSSPQASLESGEAAVTFEWNYNYAPIKAALDKAKIPLTTVIPEEGVFGNYYAQPLTVSSPQPNAGRLWIEWLLSDEGANIYAESGAVPARIAAMTKAGTLSEKAKKVLPPASVLEKITFPTGEQAEKAGQTLADEWGPATGQ